jgi:hypothetical protein
MSISRWGALALLALVVAVSGSGCASNEKKEPVTATPVTPVGEDVRARMQRLAPDAVIGRVVTIDPGGQFLAVGDAPAGGYQVLDYVIIVDAASESLADGQVISNQGDTAHVRYTPRAGASRAPAVGDLAVHFRTR